MIIVFVAAVAILPVELATAQRASAWEIGPWVRGRNSSIGMPAQPRPGPRGSAVFDFPTSDTGEVHAMTTAVGPLARARRVTMRYRVNAARGTRFVPAEQPAEQGTVSLYLQRAGDSWRGRGYWASYRWYVPGRAVIPLTPGEHSVTIRFDEVWTNVQGQPNTMLPEAYAAALAETGNVGIAFGSSSRRAHGVYATGPARFTLLAFNIE